MKKIWAIFLILIFFSSCALGSYQIEDSDTWGISLEVDELEQGNPLDKGYSYVIDDDGVWGISLYVDDSIYNYYIEDSGTWEITIDVIGNTEDMYDYYIDACGTWSITLNIEYYTYSDYSKFWFMEV